MSNSNATKASISSKSEVSVHLSESRNETWVLALKRRISRWSLDWRSGVRIALYVAVFVRSANTLLLILGAAIHGGYKDGRGTLNIGSAARISKLTTTYHILINVLSTDLLTSSSYCMQLLSAPARHDIDEAHAKEIWLDIGILSFRNLNYIPRRRAVLWVLLATSSLPLHLL